MRIALKIKTYLLLTFILLVTNNALKASVDKADSLKKTGHYEEALQIYHKELDKDIKIEDKKKQSEDYNNIANVYTHIGDYERSTEFYFKALKVAEKINDTVLQATINYNIANNYFNADKQDYCVDFLNKSVKIIANKKNTESLLGSCYNMLGGMMVAKKKYADALFYLQKAEKLFIITGESNLLSNVYDNIAYLCIDKSDYKSAIEYSRKSLSIFKKENDYDGIATSYINLQVASYNELDHKSKLFKHDALKAIYFLDSAEFALKSISSPENKIVIYQYKQIIYNDLKQYDSAYMYQNKYMTLNDSIHDIEKNKQLEEVKVQYETEKKEQEIELLKEKEINVNDIAEKRKLWIITICSLASILVLILILIIAVDRNRKKQKEIAFIKTKSELEQTALRAQMNPHFIFNALNSIQYYILNKDTEYAYDYLAKFGKLIRQVLINSEHNMIALDKEIETLKLYIELEQRRFKNRFDFEINCADELPIQEIMIPTLLIQPFVENAIWHGIMNLDEKIKGKLVLDFSVTEKIVKIRIEDNGVGRKEAAMRKINNEYASVGVLFTQKRLELLKQVTKRKANITINDLTDDTGKITGTVVEIIMEIDA